MNKQRLVVLGSDSFIISNFLEKVKDDYNLVKITRKEVNLLKENTNLKINNNGGFITGVVEKGNV